jgi:hypothetical protein
VLIGCLLDSHLSVRDGLAILDADETVYGHESGKPVDRRPQTVEIGDDHDDEDRQEGCQRPAIGA